MSDLLLTLLGVLLVALTAAIGLSGVRRRLPTPTAPDVALDLERERVAEAHAEHREAVEDVDARATLPPDERRERTARKW